MINLESAMCDFKTFLRFGYLESAALLMVEIIEVMICHSPLQSEIIERVLWWSGFNRKERLEYE